MSVHLWNTFLADEQQSCWTHALMCLFKSRRLQSYWLVLCPDRSNNQADSHQKTHEWASFTTENIWNTLCVLSGVLWFDLANDNNAAILLSKSAWLQVSLWCNSEFIFTEKQIRIKVLYSSNDIFILAVNTVAHSATQRKHIGTHRRQTQAHCLAWTSWSH